MLKTFWAEKWNPHPDSALFAFCSLWAIMHLYSNFEDNNMSFFNIVHLSCNFLLHEENVLLKTWRLHIDDRCTSKHNHKSIKIKKVASRKEKKKLEKEIGKTKVLRTEQLTLTISQDERLIERIPQA